MNGDSRLDVLALTRGDNKGDRGALFELLALPEGNFRDARLGISGDRPLALAAFSPTLKYSTAQPEFDISKPDLGIRSASDRMISLGCRRREGQKS